MKLITAFFALLVFAVTTLSAPVTTFAEKNLNTTGVSFQEAYDKEYARICKEELNCTTQMNEAQLRASENVTKFFESVQEKGSSKSHTVSDAPASGTALTSSDVGADAFVDPNEERIGTPDSNITVGSLKTILFGGMILLAVLYIAFKIFMNRRSKRKHEARLQQEREHMVEMMIMAMNHKENLAANQVKPNVDPDVKEILDRIKNVSKK